MNYEIIPTTYDNKTGYLIIIRETGSDGIVADLRIEGKSDEVNARYLQHYLECIGRMDANAVITPARLFMQQHPKMQELEEIVRKAITK